MLDNIEIIIMPRLIILGNKPFSLVIQVKYASIGENKANIVHPIIIILLYTPFVINAT